MKSISAETKFSFVIGSPVHHSLSPQMHNAGYEALGIQHLFVFLAAEVSESNLEASIAGMRAIGVRGISVTIPHKQKVIELLDSVDQIARKIGAVNTIVNNHGQLTGYNTDWLGVIGPIERVTSIEGKRVAVLGAGGAARAAVFGLKQKLGKVTVYNRSVEKAEALAREFGVTASALSDTAGIKNSDILVNCTSVGLAPKFGESPVSAEVFSSGQVVLDTVYGPLPTKLFEDATKAGAKVFDGTEMLLFQGFQQFDFYTERKAPEDAMRHALKQMRSI